MNKRQLDEFYERAYSLEHTKRYSMVPIIHEESVASHSFYVALAVMLLQERYEFNVLAAVMMAIAHDLPEMEISDVNHLVKKKYPELASAIKDVEKQTMLTFPTLLMQSCQGYDEDTVEADIVHLADAMQCVQYSLSEIKMGNQGYMMQVHQNSERRVKILEDKLREGGYER